jgi:hypothetical protein
MNFKYLNYFLGDFTMDENWRLRATLDEGSMK